MTQLQIYQIVQLKECLFQLYNLKTILFSKINNSNNNCSDLFQQDDQNGFKKIA
jgi:hypothetical protein